MKRALERHKKQTEAQAERLEERLRDHGSSPSKAKEAGEEEEAMARSIDAKWKKIVELSLREEGVRTS
jgi:ferritin-like metal-binding protein YciE